METKTNLEKKVQSVFEGWINSQDRVKRMLHSFETGNDGMHMPGHEYVVGRDGIVRCETNPGYEVPIGEHIQSETRVHKIGGSVNLTGDVKEGLIKPVFYYSVYDPNQFKYIAIMGTAERGFDKATAKATLGFTPGQIPIWNRDYVASVWDAVGCAYSSLNEDGSSGSPDGILNRDGDVPDNLRSAINSLYKSGTAPKDILDEIRPHIIALLEALEYANGGYPLLNGRLPKKRFHYITEQFKKED